MTANTIVYDQQDERRTGIHENARGAVARDLVGIRGWLILPAIGLVLSLIVGPIGLIAGLASMDSRYIAYYAPALLVNVGFYVWLWVAAVQFFKKRSTAPQTLIHFMATRIVASVILFILGLAVVGRGWDDPYFPLVAVSLLKANNFIAHGLAAAIWIPYFNVSKRVKATFVS